MSKTPRICTVALSGGMGNQLFQLAAALEIVRGHFDRVRILASPSPGLQLLETLIGRGLIRASPTAGFFVGSARPRWMSKALKQARRQTRGAAARLRLLNRSDGPLVPSERYGSASGVVRRFGSRAFASGYFQDVEWAPTQSMALATILMDSVASRSSRSSAPRTVVNVRGGDYRRLGWVLGDSYYRGLLVSEFLTRDECVTVVGDDADAISRVRKLLEESGVETRKLPAVADPVAKALQDFSAIAHATKVIMSNSTFCWWATRAGDSARSGRRVAYPSGWIDGDASTRLSRALCVPGWEPFPSPLSG